MRTTAELREGFLAFFEEKGHLRVPSASLVPRADDHSTLLTTAGMQPQMPYFLGREEPPAPLTTTVQKCFRTADIDEVGLDGHHLTFFEMLGNFSFGQYFKEGAIAYATEFVRERMKLDWDRIWVSVHAGDLRCDSLPAGFDCVTLVRILHDHDDAQALAIVARAAEALVPGGTLVVIEPMAGDDAAGRAVGGYFIPYLRAMGAGRPRTPSETATMLRAAGLGNVVRRPTPLPLIAGMLTAVRPH